LLIHKRGILSIKTKDKAGKYLFGLHLKIRFSNYGGVAAGILQKNQKKYKIVLKSLFYE